MIIYAYLYVFVYVYVHVYVYEGKKGKISLDTFLRLNIRLDNTINEIQEALENLTDEDVEDYYRREFTSLAGQLHTYMYVCMYVCLHMCAYV